MAAPFLGLALVAMVAAPQVDHCAFTGTTADGAYGATLAVVGDVDGDGADDCLIGAPNADGVAGNEAGRVELRSGRSGALLRVHEGATHLDHVGTALAGGADFDGDGIGDYALGAPNAYVSPFAGRAGKIELISGADGSLIAAFAGGHRGEGVGARLAALDDFDGDGRQDLLAVGWPDVTVRSSTGATLLTLPLDGFSVTAAARIGDLDGDGKREFALANLWHVGAIGNEGIVQIWSGADGSELAAFTGERRDDAIGRDLALAGDLDGDGVEELWVSGRDWIGFVGSATEGMVELRHGKTFAVLARIDGAAGERLGENLASGRDWNGDGLPELLVAVPGAGPFGTVRLFAGSDATLRHEWSARDDGTEQEAGFGLDLAMGDWNGDAIGDAALGASRWDDASGRAPGRVRLVLGCPAARASYGSATAGTLGVPELILDRDPELAATVTLTATNPAGAATLGLLLLGDTPIDVPFGRGAHLRVAPLVVVPIELPIDGWSLVDTVPDDPTLPFSRWYLQVLLLDAGAAGGIAATAGLELLLGFEL